MEVRMQILERLKGLFGPLSGSQMQSPGPSSPRFDAEDPRLTREIEDLLRRTEAAWNSQDFRRWIALWDEADARPFYLAAEEKDFFTQRAQLDRYVDPEGAAKVAQGIRMQFTNVRARWLAENLAYAAYHVSSEMKLEYAPKPFISRLRATSIVRRTDAGWRYVCYAEAFQSPTMYFQGLLEAAVPDDYMDYYAQVTATKNS